jgi:hypothetical protein
METTLRIRGLCGATNVDQDDFLFSDYVLLRQLLPRARDEVWMCSASLDERRHRDMIKLHGHPDADRVVIETEDYEWSTKIRKRSLKKEFVASVREATENAKSGEQVVILLNGHGRHVSNGPKGSGDIAVGCDWLGREIWLSPLEILEPVSRSNADCTVLVNACFSGVWKAVAAQLKLTKSRSPAFSLIVGCAPGDEVLSFPRSASLRFRGGFFPSCLANQLYQEYGLDLPRPKVFVSSKALDGHLKLEAVFPDSNLSFEKIAQPPVQRKFTDLSPLVEAAGAEMSLMVNGISLPETVPNDNRPALTAMGVSIDSHGGLPIQLYLLVPPAPETLHASETLNAYKRGSIGNIRDLIKSYRSILNLPPNSASNVGFEHMIANWEAGSLGLVETIKLNMRLRRRLKAYYSAKGFIESLGLVWPARYAQTPRNMQFLHYTKQISSTWFVIEGPIHWLVPCCCVANSVLDAGFSSTEFDLVCIHKKL